MNFQDSLSIANDAVNQINDSLSVAEETIYKVDIVNDSLLTTSDYINIVIGFLTLITLWFVIRQERRNRKAAEESQTQINILQDLLLNSFKPNLTINRDINFYTNNPPLEFFIENKSLELAIIEDIEIEFDDTIKSSFSLERKLPYYLYSKERRISFKVYNEKRGNDFLNSKSKILIKYRDKLKKPYIIEFTPTAKVIEDKLIN